MYPDEEIDLIAEFSSKIPVSTLSRAMKSVFIDLPRQSSDEMPP